MTFETYLENIFAKDKEERTLDDLNVWLYELDTEDWLEYGTAYAVLMQQKLIDEQTEQSVNRLKETMKEIRRCENEK